MDPNLPQPQTSIPSQPVVPASQSVVPVQPAETPTPIQPPVPQELSKKPKLSILLILLFVLLIGIGGFFGYQKYFTPKPSPTPTIAPLPTATPDPTADWEIYTNTEYKFSFRYPSSWATKEISVTGFDNQVWLASSNTSFPPSLPGQIGSGARPPISFIISNKNLSADYKEDQFNNFLSTPYKVGGLTGIKISGINKEGLTQETIISAKMGKWYINIIPLETKEKQYLDQILSTFRFTE